MRQKAISARETIGGCRSLRAKDEPQTLAAAILEVIFSQGLKVRALRRALYMGGFDWQVGSSIRRANTNPANFFSPSHRVNIFPVLVRSHFADALTAHRISRFAS